MLFRVDIYASTMVIAAVWLLYIYSTLSGRMVKMGDPRDPHMNLLSPKNDINVCNYNVFGFNILQNNTSEEIECYLKALVHKQSASLWKSCDYTLYDILHNAKKRKILKVLVFVDDVFFENKREQRTTSWGDQQTENLERVLTQSVNEWRQTLHDEFPNDFFKKDHVVKIRAVTRRSETDHLERYEPLAWSSKEDTEKGLTEMEDITKINYKLPAHETIEFDIVIAFRSKDRNTTMAHVNWYREYLSEGGFETSRCFRQGVLININDVPKESLPYFPRAEFGAVTFATCFILLTAATIMFYKKTSMKLVILSVLVSSVVALSLAFSGVAPTPPVKDNHPQRFSSDVFPVALLTHELGHLLLMPDHYKEDYNKYKEKVMADELPGPTRPFSKKCAITPISIMGAENQITELDRAYVRATWAMKMNRTKYKYNSWDTESESEEILEVKEKAKDLIDDNPQFARLISRSCMLVEGESQQQWTPDVCTVTDTRRVKLTGDRGRLHFYMNNLAIVVELFFVCILTYFFYRLWWQNEQRNIENLANGGHLHYRELLNTPVLLLVILYAAYTWWKTTNIARCVGVEQSLASWVVLAQFILAVPLIPLIIRRLLVLLGVWSGHQDAETGNVSEQFKGRVDAERTRLQAAAHDRAARKAAEYVPVLMTE